MGLRHLYNNEFTSNQIAETKKSLRGSIFFLLLCVDKETKKEYENVNVEECFTNLLTKIGGMNELLLNQKEIVITMSLLQSALQEYRNKEFFDFKKYRKLILDAGAEIAKLREGE